MEAWEIAGAAAVGFAAGITSGLIGVGGGVLFVPGLVLFLGLSQLDAEATSLVAVVIVALVGAWRQHGYGNVRLRGGGHRPGQRGVRAHARARLRRRAAVLRLAAR